MRPRVLSGAFVAATVACLANASSAAQPVGGSTGEPTSTDSLLVSTEWLAERLTDPRVVVLHVVHGVEEYRRGHIPGARPLSYMEITQERDGIGTELPEIEHLREVFERVGVSDDSYVVLYGDPIGMAARAFFTLEYVGHARVALLDGGLTKWRAERRPVTKEPAHVTRGRITPRPRRVAVDADWILPRLGQPGVSLIDTRTDEEFLGTGGRRGMPSAGRIEGARQLQWEQLFRDPRSGQFLGKTELARLYAERVMPGDTVVTYCYVGYRASLTYFAARLLGYPVHMYDGSYQDWARRGLPLVKTPGGNR